MRNMSFSLTERQFLAGEKDVTRRKGWEFLKVGERFRAVRKGMGLKKGEKVVVLGLCEVVTKRRECLDAITNADCAREGFPDFSRARFCEMFCFHMGGKPSQIVTRIEFKKL